MNKLQQVAALAQAMTPLHLLIGSLGKDGKTMDSEAVKSKLFDIVPEGSRTPHIEVSDAIYTAPSEKHFTSFASWDQTDAIVYREEIFDCDNFAIIFYAKVMEAHLLHADSKSKKSIAVGVVHGRFYLAEEANGKKYKKAKEINHAMNIVITANQEVYLFEPQTDTLYKPDERNQYRLILI